jgi:hypothetical protein
MRPDFSRTDSDLSYTQAKYKRPHNPRRLATARACQEMTDGGRGFSVRTIPVSAAESSDYNVVWLMYRCECAHSFWRDEFAGVMQYWLQCWRAGFSQVKTDQALRISTKEGAWLRTEIRKYIRVGPPPRIKRGHPPLRRMKGGVACDVIRRRRLAYKQSQSLKPQQDSPFS